MFAILWFGSGKGSKWIDLNRVTALFFSQYVRNWSSWKIEALWPDEVLFFLAQTRVSKTLGSCSVIAVSKFLQEWGLLEVHLVRPHGTSLVERADSIHGRNTEILLASHVVTLTGLLIAFHASVAGVWKAVGGGILLPWVGLCAAPSPVLCCMLAFELPSFWKGFVTRSLKVSDFERCYRIARARNN